MIYTLGFLGAGNMAEAIAQASIRSGIVPAMGMIAADPSEARRQVFAKLGVTVVESNAEVIKQSQQVLVAVKPQVMASAADDLRRHMRDEQVVISIMAGVSSARLVEAIGRPARIVRVMPNTPMLVSQGMAGVALGAGAEEGDDELAVRLFGAGGKAIRVSEDLLDAITAVSGSGPAYLFYLAEAMERAASELGLGEHARLLVAQTLLGAAALLDQSPDTAAELRRKVTSPGGTTEAAISHLDQHDAGRIIVDAIKAAHARSVELGKS